MSSTTPNFGMPFLLSRYSDLNLNLRVTNIETSKSFMKARFENVNGNLAQVEKMTEEVYRKFLCDWEVASKSFKDHIAPFAKPEHYLLHVLNLFAIFVEDKLNAYLAEVPEQTDILKEWDECKRNIALMRYEPSKSTFEKIQKFISLVQQRLIQYGANSQDIEEVKFWAAWESLLSNGDLIDLMVNDIYINKLNRFPKVGIQHIFKAYNLIMQKWSLDLKWLVHELEIKLVPYKNLQDDMTLNAPGKLKVLNIVRNAFLPLIERGTEHDLQEFIVNCQNLVSLIKQFDEVSKSPGFPFFNRDSRTDFIKKIIADPLERKKEDIVDFKYFIDKYRKGFTEYNLLLDLRIDWNGLEEILKLCMLDDECHRMWDIYVTNPLVLLQDIATDITKWHQAQIKAKKIELCLKQFHWEHFGEPELQDIDELLNTLEDKPKASAVSKEKPVKKKEADRKIPQKKQAKPPVEPPKKVNAKQIISLPSEPKPVGEKWDPQAMRLIALVASLNETFKFKRSAVRQSLMNFEDLQVLKQNGVNQIPVELRSAVASQVWQTVHRLFEQTLRYTVLVQKFATDQTEKLDEHHLKYYEKYLKMSQDIKKIVDSVYLANFWVGLTYLQEVKRSQKLIGDKQLPLVLSHVIELAENPASDKSVKIMEDLPNLLKQTSDQFTKYSFDIPSGVNLVNPLASDQREVKVFKLTWNAPLKHFSQINLIAKKVIESHPKDSVNPGVLHLKQVLKDIQILEGHLRKLNGLVSSKEFSMIVRNVSHFEHLVVQNLLRSVLYFQTGSDSHEHELSDLYGQISWDGGPEFNKGDLDLCFKDIHRLSYYPFDVKGAVCQLHQAVLASELLREMPALDEGFQLSKANVTATTLNFIPVDSSLLKADRIVNVIQSAHLLLEKLIAQKILPQLQTHVAAKEKLK